MVMAQVDPQKQALYSRLSSIESDISSAYGAISDVESKIARVDGSIGSLQSRLVAVRGRGYSAMGYLEKSVEMLSRKWAESGPLIKQAFFNSVQPLASQIRILQTEVQNLRNEINMGNLGMGQSLASRLSIEASSMRARACAEASKVGAPLGELSASADAIDRDLRIAESTVTLFSQASFPLKPEESPVLAIEGRSMSGEKNEGTLCFTNQRFVFEGKREVVLEKKLFIVTKKRTERVVIIEQPIGALQEIAKGRVGLLAWTGIYIRFKPERGLAETPFDVKGWEADVIMRFFNYIIGGEADRDIAQVRGIPTATTAPTIQVVRCSNCNAPYTQEIFKGQTSVKCEYCGTQIIIR
jgi:DNA-directed RNA polymerase subunit RPC12/RpoP